MKRKRILSIDVTTGTYGAFVDRIAALARDRISSYVCVANVHMVVEAILDKSFAAVVNGADLVTPDGMPLCKAVSLLYNTKQERVAGMDLLPDLLAMANANGLSVFLFGSTDTVLETIKKRATLECPHLKIVGNYSPPFRPPTAQETLDEVVRINDTGANIVLVALGCPKQERWMASNKGRINAVMVGVGGAFPVYAGMQRRAPKLMQRLALEWVFRLCQEPRRLFKRYAFTNSLFLLHLGRALAMKALNREGIR